ncbi:MAG: cation:proton antiporter [Gammaproteobacteria bacterium]|nr:MAG: cation:proton antiporter [Gammaproteobacteria bacterium]
MEHGGIIESFFLIFTGSALIATLALYARQALIVGYIVLGLLLGPDGLGWVTDPHLLQQISDIGIMFLLFLLGIDLMPEQMLKMFGEAVGVTLASSLTFLGLGYGIALLTGFGGTEAWLIGAAAMFSSTIIGLKLLPTTALHHRHTGQVVISILLIQDLIAIVILLLIEGSRAGGDPMTAIARNLVALPLLLFGAILFQRLVLARLMERFDQIQEYLFLLTIGWCLGVAQLAHAVGLSHEIGAFIAGVALASNPIALVIEDRLKPLRDFFLILFFFSLGASFDLEGVGEVWVPALLLAGVMLLAKPLVFMGLLRTAHEKRFLSLEIGVRLGQISEFSLLIAVVATQVGVIGERAGNVIQLATLVTFIASSYYIVMRYRTPIAVSDRLRQD